MSGSDRTLTEEDLQLLLKALGHFFESSGPAVQALFDQARANSLVCALLLREMTLAGLINADAVRKEALDAADRLDPPGSGAGVAKFIASIFGGEQPDIPMKVVLQVIQGGLSRTPAQPGTRQSSQQPAVGGEDDHG